MTGVFRLWYTFRQESEARASLSDERAVPVSEHFAYFAAGTRRFFHV